MIMKMRPRREGGGSGWLSLISHDFKKYILGVVFKNSYLIHPF